MGEALWDMLPEGKKIGGAPANFAYHISQFGIDSRVVSAVGKDMAGSELLENLRDKSLKGLIEKTDFPTGSVEVEVDEKGIPCYNIREDVAWDHIPFTPQTAELARQTQAVCFGSLAQRHPASRSTIHRFLDTMPDGDEQYKIFDINLRQGFYTQEIICKYSINSLVYWVTYVHNVVYSFYRSMIYCYINSTQRCAGSIVIDIIPTNGADKRKFFPFAPYFPVTNVIKRYFYPYFPAIIGIKGYSFPYFPYLSGIMKIKTALYSLFSRLDWHKTVVFPCLGEIYEGIRSLSWEIPVT
mgnify:CR=1 FL=1